MGSSSHDLGAELRMHYFTVNCDTFSNEEKVAAVVPVTSVEVTCSEAMLALSFSTDNNILGTTSKRATNHSYFGATISSDLNWLRRVKKCQIKIAESLVYLKESYPHAHKT